jgi:nucleotide-binding universal stress UspA family protein
LSGIASGVSGLCRHRAAAPARTVKSDSLRETDTMSTTGTPTTAPAPFGAPNAAAPAAPAARGPIVVATTGDDGTAALETAAALAAHDGRGVAVISVVELPPATAGLDGSLLVPDVDAYADMQRARVLRQLGALSTVSAVSDAARAWPVEVIVDDPARAIADAARARGASLLVMGTGRHDLAARMLGEVALRAARYATCPVLVVGHEPMRVPPDVAVAAVDFSPSSVIAARAALEFLAPGGTLHLVHAWLPHTVLTPSHLAQDEAYERQLPTHFGRVERELLDRARDVTIVPASRVGNAREELVAFAKSSGAELLAAGRRGHGLLELLVVGRVTTALLREAPCAVLVTPEPTLAERDALQRALWGTSESRAHGEWGALLEAFTRRNAGRRARLEVDDPALGAQTQETGWAFLGAAYDRHDHRVALMFGGAADATAHLTRSIERVSSVAVLTGADGRDTALQLTHGTAQTLLTFLPERA